MSLPLVDFALLDSSSAPPPELVETIRSALLEENGAFCILNHGIPLDLVDAMFDQIATFMGQPIESKLSAAVDESSPIWEGSGYYTFGESEARQMRGVNGEAEKKRAAAKPPPTAAAAGADDGFDALFEREIDGTIVNPNGSPTGWEEEEAVDSSQPAAPPKSSATAAVEDDRSTKAETSSAKRRMTEFYMLKFAREAYDSNTWPSSEGFRETADAYVAGVLEMARRLIPLVAAALDLPLDAFDRHFSNPNAQFRCNHYPAALEPEESEAAAAGADAADNSSSSKLRIGAHTDSSFMTFLPQRANQPRGLEVQLANGEWISPSPPGGSMLVNTVADRISLPLFLHPNWTSLIDPTLGSGGGEQQGEAAPPQFPSVTVGDFMSKWHTGRLYREDDQLSKL